jgi:hypothetical protein
VIAGRKNLLEDQRGLQILKEEQAEVFSLQLLPKRITECTSRASKAPQHVIRPISPSI